MREVICLNCDDWGSRVALDVHGELVRDKGKVAHELKGVESKL